MKRRGHSDVSISGILLSVLGIFLMLDRSNSGGWEYIVISMAAGISVVLSRTVNARLSEQTGALQGSLINHLAGVPVCLLLALCLPETAVHGSFRLWMWCGGILGVISVAVCNLIVPRIPACKLTLFTFCGQLFCGIALDILNGRELNEREFHAGLLVSMGIAVSQLSAVWKKRKKIMGR